MADNSEILTADGPPGLYLAGMAPSSQRTQRGALQMIARLLGAADVEAVDWPGLDYADLVMVRAALAGHYAPATANRALAALRGVLRAASKLGRMTAEKYQIAADLAPVRGNRAPAGRHITPAELGAMLATCSQDPAGARDRAILLALYGCGLRRAELAGLELADYDQAGAVLLVRGKGNRERRIPTAGAVVAAMADWLTVRGPRPGPLFWGMGSRNSGGRMTPAAVYHLVKRRARAAGVADLSPHDFRRSFCGELLDRGADLATVQALAGHQSPITTARYDRRPERTRRRAVELLQLGG